jgi:protein SCO1/2
MAPFAGGRFSMSAAGSTPDATSQATVSAMARKRIQEQHLPNISLLTHEGKRVRFYHDLVKDKIVTINFFFAQCEDICPIVIANLVKVQKILGDQVGRDLFMYSFTLKPEVDTVDVLKHHMKMHGVQPGWTFLTGKPKDMELLRRSVGFTNPDPKLDQDINQHIGNVRYGNEPLMLWGVCPGMAHAEWIAESIGWMVRPDTIRVKVAGSGV